MKYDFSIIVALPSDDSGIYEIPYHSTDDRNEIWHFTKHPPEVLKKPNSILLVKEDGQNLRFTYVYSKKRIIPVTESDPCSKSMGWAQTPTVWKSKKNLDLKLRWLTEEGVDRLRVSSCLREMCRKAIVDLKLSESLLELSELEIYNRWTTTYHELHPTAEQKMVYALRASNNASGPSCLRTIREVYTKSNTVPFSEKDYDAILKKHISLIDLLLARTINERLLEK